MLLRELLVQEMDEFCTVVDAEFFVDVGQVGFDGVFAEMHGFGNFFVVHAFSHEFCCFCFSLGQTEGGQAGDRELYLFLLAMNDKNAGDGIVYGIQQQLVIFKVVELRVKNLIGRAVVVHDAGGGGDTEQVITDSQGQGGLMTPDRPHVISVNMIGKKCII